jgi:hypothetical protein
MSLHKIDYAEARVLLFNYLNNPELNPVDRGLSFGATMSTKSLLEPKTFLASVAGVRVWFSYLPTSASIPDFFLAFENVSIELSEIGNITTMSETLAAPGNSSKFLFTDPDKSLFSIDRYISNKDNFSLSNDRLIEKFYNPITGSLGEIDYLTAFNTSFPRGPLGRSFNPIGAGFFDNAQNDIDDFVLQLDSKGNKIQSFRYFFGIDTSEKYINYPIRVMLFGVDHDGSTLVGKESIILERGYPPKEGGQNL